jgi:hypothetical protein
MDPTASLVWDDETSRLAVYARDSDVADEIDKRAFEAGLSAVLDVEVARFNRRDLESIARNVVVNGIPGIDATVGWAGPNSDSSGIEVGLIADELTGSRARIAGLAVENIPVEVSEVSSELPQLAARWSNYGTNRFGGALWQTSSSACSTAMTVARGLITGQYVYYMATAAHCGSSSQTA